MRCKLCDKILEDHEATKKDFDGEYMDICDDCEEEIWDESDDDDDLYWSGKEE